MGRKKMTGEYYKREINAVISTLKNEDSEMPIIDLLEQAGVDLFVAPSVISILISEGKISYRMKDGKQYFSLNKK